MLMAMQPVQMFVVFPRSLKDFDPLESGTTSITLFFPGWRLNTGSRKAAEVAPAPAPVCFADRALRPYDVRRYARATLCATTLQKRKETSGELCSKQTMQRFHYSALPPHREPLWQRGSAAFRSTQQCKFSLFYSFRLASLRAQCCAQ